MALTGSLDSEHRRAEIVQLARTPKGVTLDDLAARFEVSTMTIRRDLTVLEEDGLVRRVRGGAIADPAPRKFGDRLAQREAAKREIARKALAFVPDTGTIAFDASTTISTLAGMLGGRGDLAVCTNAPQTFAGLAPLDGVRPMLTGGELEPVTGSLVGPLAVQAARALRTDVFFASVAAFDTRDGGSEVSLAEAEVKQFFADRADRTILCLDSSKLGERETARSLDVTQVSMLITELDPSHDALDPYRELFEIL